MVLIERDNSSQMMRITKDGKVLFEGNFWDFHLDSIYDILKECGVEVAQDDEWEYPNE
jgi:hypothetical protein